MKVLEIKLAKHVSRYVGRHSCKGSFGVGAFAAIVCENGECALFPTSQFGSTKCVDGMMGLQFQPIHRTLKKGTIPDQPHAMEGRPHCPRAA